MYGDRIRERTWRELCSGSLATRIHNGGPSGWARWAERADAQCGQLIETGTLLNDYNHLSITASAYINYSAKNTRANANSTFDPWSSQRTSVAVDGRLLRGGDLQLIAKKCNFPGLHLLLPANWLSCQSAACLRPLDGRCSGRQPLSVLRMSVLFASPHHTRLIYHRPHFCSLRRAASFDSSASLSSGPDPN